MKFNKFFNILFYMILAFLLISRAPLIFENFQAQNQKAPDFNVSTLDQKNFQLSQQSKTVIVFWATWCAPCEVELKRINSMILNKKINPLSVIAIAGDEDPALIDRVAKKMNYQFRIGLDQTRSVHNLFNVKATPTIVFIDENKLINWISTGISPSLELRMSSFLNN